jgi:hypothetical protein
VCDQCKTTDTENLRKGNDQEHGIAARTDTSQCDITKIADEIQIDEIIERLNHHADTHWYRHFNNMRWY